MPTPPHCQACHAQEVALYECAEGILLCEDCCQQREQEHAPHEDEPSVPAWSLSQRAAIFGSSALLMMGLPALLHAPLPAEVFGLGAAIALALHSPTWYAHLREEMPEPLAAWLDGLAERSRRRAGTGQWSTWDRLLARHWQDEQPQEEAEQQRAPDHEQQAEAAPQPQPTEGAWVPPQFVLDDVLDVVQAFNKQGCVYFGNSEQGAIALAPKEIYHVLDVSSSGKGKSNRFRLALLQVVGQCQTYYINPFAANVKAVTDSRQIEVWKPLYDRLANHRPLKAGPEIKDLLSGLVQELARRNEQEECGEFGWQQRPIFVFIDELPEVFARCPEAIKLLDTIGRTGRQFAVFCWVASQTANVNEIGQSTAAQANYKTRIYGGGDKPSAERLMKGAVPKDSERTLQTSGAGLSLMLAEGLEASSWVRAPLVSNEALFAYLGLPPFRKEDWLRTAPPRQENEQTPFPPFTLSSDTTPQAEQRTPWLEQGPVCSVSIFGSRGNSAETPQETALQANSEQVITRAFPVSSPEVQHVPASVSKEQNPVSIEIREAIRRMKEAKYPDRDIAHLLGLSGRKYALYRQVLQQMGYTKEAE